MNPPILKKTGRAFIIRPFNLKENNKGETINFNRVDNELITPALKHIGLSGGTTAEFIQQGNIRLDMFRELLSADLVIADISIHNTNVFYELGIRHALHDKYTVMIKANKNIDPHIFDLNSDRYMLYDPDEPATSIDGLIKVITATLESELVDSPIFQLLPELKNIDPTKVIVVPLKFREQIELHKKDINYLSTLLNEATGEYWETAAFRLIGTTQFNLGEYKQASGTLERVIKFNNHDAEANQILATCYRKLGQFTLSDQAAKRSLKNKLSDWNKAETYALIGSNHKTRWREQWENKETLEQRQNKALISTLLKKTYDAYHRGFEQHRNHYYSGFNAAAIQYIQLELAKLHPQTWLLDFDDKQDADFALKKISKHYTKLVAATDLAITSSIKNYPKDKWARVSQANLMLLTSDNPEKIKQKYQKCIEDITEFTASSIMSQVKLYHSLGLLKENVNAILEIIE